MLQRKIVLLHTLILLSFNSICSQVGMSKLSVIYFPHIKSMVHKFKDTQQLCNNLKLTGGSFLHFKQSFLESRAGRLKQIIAVFNLKKHYRLKTFHFHLCLQKFKLHQNSFRTAIQLLSIKSKTKSDCSLFTHENVSDGSFCFKILQILLFFRIWQKSIMQAFSQKFSFASIFLKINLLAAYDT